LNRKSFGLSLPRPQTLLRQLQTNLRDFEWLQRLSEQGNSLSGKVIQHRKVLSLKRAQVFKTPQSFARNKHII